MLWRAPGRPGLEAGGTRVQGEMLIMGRMKGARADSSRAEWCSVSRLPHTLAHSMLLQLHKLPRNYPEGMPREGGSEGGRKDSERVKGDRAEPGVGHTVIGRFRIPVPDVGLQVAGSLNGAANLKAVIRTVSNSLEAIYNGRRLVIEKPL